jgi:hypothetical protein
LKFFIIQIILFFIITTSTAHAEYPTDGETSEQVASRILGGFARCAGAMINIHRAEIHTARMMGLDLSLPTPIFNDCAGSSYVIFCHQAGNDEQSCYNNLRHVMQVEMQKAGEE